MALEAVLEVDSEEVDSEEVESEAVLEIFSEVAVDL